MTDANPDLVIGAGSLRWRRALALLPILLLGIALLWSRSEHLIRDGQGGVVVIIGLTFVAVMGALFGYVAMAIRNFKIVVTGTRVSYTNWRGHKSSFDRSEIKEVVIRLISVGGGSYARSALVIGLDGVALARWGAQGDAGERLAPLWQQLGIQPDESVTDPVRAKDIRNEYPGSVSWATAHTTWTGVVMLIVIVGLIVGYAVISRW